MPRLFTLFYQARPALGRSEGGLGVGLALVRGLVTLHGGRIEAHSDGSDRGSEFVVRLPIGAPPVSVSKIGVDADNSPAARLRVIVVDDNRDAADSCAVLLGLSGHDVQSAYSGSRALALAETFHPHVLLLDIGLPDVNGYELARNIRAAPWGRGVVLIAVTGWGQTEDRRRAFDAGFDHHLTKPIAPESLEVLLQSLGSARPGAPQDGFEEAPGCESRP
jgi:CheY-like chemotaxis protein